MCYNTTDAFFSQIKACFYELSCPLTEKISLISYALLTVSKHIAASLI